MEELWELNEMWEELAEWNEARAPTDEVSDTKGNGWVQSVARVRRRIVS